jgi:exodeoxyribonuclease VII small subunit
MSVASDEFTDWERAADDGTFEDALTALEQVARRLEAGNLSLADSVRCYEIGNRLANRCGAMLDEAELRISRLDEPNMSEVPF